MNALETERVAIGKGEVIVTEIWSTEYIALYSDETLRDEKGEVDMNKFVNALITKAVIDEEGNRILSDDDRKAFEKAKPKLYLKIANAVKRLNGLSGDEAKNSEPSLTDSSSSDSV